MSLQKVVWKRLEIGHLGTAESLIRKQRTCMTGPKRFAKGIVAFEFSACIDKWVNQWEMSGCALC